MNRRSSENVSEFWVITFGDTKSTYITMKFLGWDQIMN